MKKKLLLVLGVSVIYNTSINAQFQEAIGYKDSEFGKSVQYDAGDKSYIIAGYTGGADANLTKTDNSGAFLWSHLYGTTGKDLFHSVKVVPTLFRKYPTYIAAGQTSSFGAGSYDFLLVGTDNFGTPLFTQTFGKAGSDAAYQVQVIRDQLQKPGYALVGETSSYPTLYPGKNIYVVTTDLLGNYTDAVVVGTQFDEVGYAIEQAKDGGYLIAGYTTAKTPADVTNNKNIYVLKLNAALNVVWSRIIGGVGNQEDVAYSIKENPYNNSIIVTGSTRSFGNGEESFLLNLNQLGGLNWFKVYGAYKDERAQSVLITKDASGNPQYAVTGYTNSYNATNNPDVLFYKTALNGALIWSRTYGGKADDYAFEVAGNFTGATHEYALVGHTNSFATGLYDILLIETDNNGKSASHCEKTIAQKEYTYTPYISANAQNVHVKDYKQYQTPYPALEYKINYCSDPSYSEINSDVESTSSGRSLFLVSPVPASSALTITFSEVYDGSNLTVFNNLGAVVAQHKLGSGNFNLDISGLASGVYFLHAVKTDGTAKITKFIKE
jgi:hypothetical protein